MKIKYILLCVSSFVIACAGAEFSEEEYLRRQQNEGLCLKLREQADKGDKLSCYALANYYYLGKQFWKDPENIKASYYRGEDGKSRVNYKLGNVHVEREDYEKAFKLYEQAALKDHGLSIWSLGECYELGRGTNEDLKKAVEYYRRAAKADYSFAQRSLGLMYLEGCGGLPKDDLEAIRLFREAANSGLAAAQYNLGMMYILGRGVKKNKVEAVRWLRKAADQGDARAQTSLGEMYRDGRGGLAKSDSEAVKWYRKACDQGYEKARPCLEALNQKVADQKVNNHTQKSEKKNNPNKKVLNQKAVLTQNSSYNHALHHKALPKGSVNLILGRAQLYADVQNYREALKYFRMAADQGDARAYNTLGLMYEDGQGTAQSDSEAAKCYREAAERNHAMAQANLARMYRDGCGVPQSDFEAVKWYKKSAVQGCAGGQSNLAMMYLEGRGVAQNIDKAAKLFRMAADQGYGPAQLNLAQLYENGYGVEKSESEAKKLKSKASDAGCEDLQGYSKVYYSDAGIAQRNPEEVRNAAEQGDIVAQFRMGAIYMEGLLGMNKNYAEALKWYHKAADKGDILAQFCIGMMYMSGQGVEKSESEALKWLRKSADQGDKNAQTILTNLSKKEKINKEFTLDAKEIAQVEKVEQIKQWHPSDGELIRAAELVMILKREKGASPNASEMLLCVQSKMNISSSQAEIILDELGLVEIVT